MEDNSNRNIEAMKTIFNNNINMNQNFYNNMQNYQNNLYFNNFNQTWTNMQVQAPVNNINMNNMLNILSLINFPVIVPYHSEHPLINCYTPGRTAKYKNWICDKCNTKYTFNVPSFYCTACDFDLCQKCLLSLGAYQIVIYNYSTYALVNLIQEFRNTQNLNLKIHQHPMVFIQRERTHSTLDLKCNQCYKDFQIDEQFYYCSLCNYCFCGFCYAKATENLNS